IFVQRRGRSPRQHYATRAERRHGGAGILEGVNFAINARLADAARDQLGDLRTEVHNEYGVGGGSLWALHGEAISPWRRFRKCGPLQIRLARQGPRDRSGVFLLDRGETLGHALAGTVQEVQLTQQRLLGADFLRASACLMVLLHHLAFRMDMGNVPDGATPVLAFLVMGSFGVCIFFVLSGYLLARPFWLALDRGEAMPSLRDYTLRRAARILRSEAR